MPRFPQAYTRAQLDEITAIESRSAVVVGYVARLLQMGDGDYHIQITALDPVTARTSLSLTPCPHSHRRPEWA